MRELEEEHSDIQVLASDPNERAFRVTTTEADALIAQQLLRLSIQDRERVYHDLHGVSDAVQETPEFVAGKLIELEAKLQELPEKKAYETAKAMDPEYVLKNDFRLKFLRADLFDAQQAALRIARHFEAKLELFGRDKLARDIEQDDLDPFTMDRLYQGGLQMLPQRDRAGRRLMLLAPVALQPIIPQSISHLRRTFYLTQVASEDIETQKNGFVVVGYFIGRSAAGRMRNREHFRRIPRLLMALPLRMNALHLCYDSLLWEVMWSIIKMSASMFTRLRIRTHYGSRQECLLQLQTFGIPLDHFPVKDDGTMENKLHVEHLTKQRTLERHRRVHGVKGVVGVPDQKDVLCGKGKSIQNHIGNIRFRQLVQDCRSTYDNADSDEKKRMTLEVLEIVKQSGGRFLKDESELGWIEVDNETARLKVSSTFRSARKPEYKGRKEDKPARKITGDKRKLEVLESASS